MPGVWYSDICMVIDVFYHPISVPLILRNASRRIGCCKSLIGRDRKALKLSVKSSNYC